MSSQSAAPVASASTEPGGQWSHDARVRFDPESNTYVYQGDDGVAFEYDQAKAAWFPQYNEALVRAQQSVYGGDTDDHAQVLSAKEKRKAALLEIERKRQKVADPADPSAAPHTASASASATGTGTAAQHEASAKKPARPNTSVYVTGLPIDTSIAEIHAVFSKCGIILEDPATGQPRIKLYRDAAGRIKGDALVIYFKEESVALAEELLDESRFRDLDGGVIRVQKAVFSEKKEDGGGSGGSGGGGAAKGAGAGAGGDKDKKQTSKTRKKLESKLAWFESEENKVSAKAAKVVVLRHMFTLQELQDDPTLLLDLNQEVREECEKLGEVTNVVLYDDEPSGIMTVRFKDPESAQLCIHKMNGRFFGGQRVEAGLWNGRDKFKQSKGQAAEDEAKRLDEFSKWLEQDDNATDPDAHSDDEGES
ncbi:hypothetical protein BC831DRAFT_453765 [Entophlyctis helioformis]|nr:hypothetical protein BC831DRAFT_453765 [Entophlyctis helioformis]